MANMSPTESFETWMRGAGITWDTAAIRLVAADTPAATATAASTNIVPCTGTAFGVVAARDVQEGDVLCTIPTTACITIKTTSIADIIEAEELGGGLGLVIAVMHEAGLGDKSPWYGYFTSMPQREYIPVFWIDTELSSLVGTDLEGAAESDLAAMKDDYDAHIQPLLQAYPDRLSPAAFTFEAMKYAASLVASRAFGIDDEHGDGMVPLADAFNHKVSVVDLAPEYVVAGQESSSDEEGEEESEEESENSGSEDIEESEGEEEESEEEEEDVESEEEEQGGEGVDGGDGKSGVMRQQGGELHSVYGISKANGLHLALQMAIVDQQGSLQIVAASPVPKGSEIHNTYGELGNAELVKKYGFALAQNPFTVVTLNKDDVIEACRAQHQNNSEKTDKRSNKRLKGGPFDALLSILEEETHLLEEDDEPFQVLPNGHVSPALFVALRVLCSGITDKESPINSKAVKSVEDALRLPGEGGVLDLGEVAGIQVWCVTDDNGVAMAEKKAEKKAEKNILDTEGETASGMVTAAMCRALAAAVNLRMDKYPTSLKKTQREVRVMDKVVMSGSGLVGDAQAAERAALTLRLTEQEILEGMVMAVRCRLRQLG